jgi:putative inorganic carbon (hco3(-)) transporter
MKGLIAIYLLTAVGALGGPFQPLLALFVYVLFATLRPQFMWGFAGDFAGISQWVGYALLGGWAFRGFGGRRLGRGGAPVIFLVLFTIWTAISSFQAIDTRVATQWLVELLKVTLPFLAGVTLLNSNKLARWMLWVIVLAHGYISYDMNTWYYLSGYNRIYDSGYGGMDNNSFGLSLVTALGPAFALGLATKKWPERIVAFTCAALILHTIILTYSRGAMLGLIVVLVVTFALIPKRPSILAMALVGALLTARLAGPEVVARFDTVFADSEQRDGSAQSRVDLWAACLEIATRNPVFGIGPRNFHLVADQYGFTAGKEAHSTWMSTMAEMGFPALVLLVLFYGTTIVRLWPLARAKWTDDTTRSDAAVATGIMISMMGFFVSAQFVSMTGLETPYYVAMVGVALLKNSTREAVPALAPADARQPAPQPAIVGPAPHAPVPVAPGLQPTTLTGRRFTGWS